jgi:hypothetical protein
MPAPASQPDLLDLKLLPAWVKEAPQTDRYADFSGEDAEPFQGAGRIKGDGRRPRQRQPAQRKEHLPSGRSRARTATPRHSPPRETTPSLAVNIRFLPNPRSLENVLAQIKSSNLAYSVFSLARLFLEKPERYEVRLKSSEGTSFFQLGDHGAIASVSQNLESNAFALSKEDFYRIEVVQSEPIKGNFSSIARCRISGIFLGPTNHHSYQPQLRSLYEQRFNRRMSFPEYQRQIEIVNDLEMVERWKEEARNVTKYTTLREEPAITFNSTAEAERHFRQKYLPGLLRSASEVTIDGVLSRNLPDRALGRLIEAAWAREMRSPTGMMQELIGALRQSGLHIFRHRRGMLFVTPTRLKAIGLDTSALSQPIAAILNTINANAGIHRKRLTEQLIAPDEQMSNGEVISTEKQKLVLASDLRWLIGEGHVIEFNDGTFDLPRTKPKVPAELVQRKSETDLADSAAPAEIASEHSNMESPPAEIESADASARAFAGDPAALPS